MKPFRTHTGIVAPLDRANVDTDAIIPKQYLKSVKRTGFGPAAFDTWRYLDPGEPDMDHSRRLENPEFVLNQPPFREATILLTRENFGCGSSREHAVWALADFGIRVLIAPSFADIFHGNCFKSGLLPIELAPRLVDRIFASATTSPPLRLTVDLETQTIAGFDAEPIRFEIDSFRRRGLLEGLDDIALTLQRSGAIRAYEDRRRKEAPWLFPEGPRRRIGPRRS